ncbi:hypothetical protein KP509_38G006100 [Ceratopteris richardii]|uniref:Uncharacterized protein n=1 Tax=Ceratopteris richardii TaxID=49495 RepID=A0A8T2Q2C4_CERRI|nr:hypothetical protein KP509_38G006100 [Ceratopteris richardii]
MLKSLANFHDVKFFHAVCELSLHLEAFPLVTL